MALGAYDDTTESFHDDVSMRLAFSRDRLFFILYGGGLGIALGETRAASESRPHAVLDRCRQRRLGARVN